MPKNRLPRKLKKAIKVSESKMIYIDIETWPSCTLTSTLISRKKPIEYFNYIPNTNDKIRLL